MKILDTCGYCEKGQISMSVCPSCWGTTVSPETILTMKSELERIRQLYSSKKKESLQLSGKARGMAGQELAQIGGLGRALRDNINEVEAQAQMHKIVAKVVGAAAA